MKQKKIHEYKLGTLIRYKRRLYSIQAGMDDDLLVDVNTGIWYHIHTCNWKTFHVVYEVE